MEDDYNKKSRILIGAVFVAFVSIVLLISSIAAIGNRDFSIINFDSGNNKDLLSNKEIKALKDALSRSLNASKMNDSDISIRWSSFSEPMSNYKIFLVDLDSIKQTYSVIINNGIAELNCPKPSETRYPDSFCRTNDGEENDSVYATFGESIPYDDTADNGVKYRLYRKGTTSTLIAHIYSCQSDANEEAVSADIRAHIKELGANPDIFKISFEFNNCKK